MRLILNLLGIGSARDLRQRGVVTFFCVDMCVCDVYIFSYDRLGCEAMLFCREVSLVSCNLLPSSAEQKIVHYSSKFLLWK
jgi:hypothetical protein